MQQLPHTRRIISLSNSLYCWWCTTMLRIRSCMSISRALDVSSFHLNHFSSQTSLRKLEGKVALITGAASGIGKEAAATFIAHGAKVVIADIHHALGRAAAAQLGPNATFTPCDVAHEPDVSDAVDFALSRHGRLDIMYNNAGVPCRTPHTVLDLDLRTFDRVMAVNVRGVLAGIKHATRAMAPRRTGSILCTASVTAVLGGMAQHTYSISKSAVVGMVRSLAAELCPHGIRINCVSPFVIPTPFVMEEMREYFPDVDDGGIGDMVRDAGELKGACCEPRDVANAALFLVSDDAKYVSGHNLVVDGGFTTIKSCRFRVPGKEL